MKVQGFLCAKICVLAWGSAILLGACSETTSSSSSGGTSSSSLIYSQDFSGLADGASWPSEWTIPASGTNSLMTADVQGGRGRLRSADANGDADAIGRIVLRSPQTTNWDAYYTVEYESIANQGIGFYGRQNGGLVDETTPNGIGYGVYLEGSGTDFFHFWYENGMGSEVQYSTTGADDGDGGIANPIALSNGVRYRIRFQGQQIDSDSTRLRAKIWQEGSSEPSSWLIIHQSDASDSTAESTLQNTSDGFCIDLYNYDQTNSVYIDDIEIYSF